MAGVAVLTITAAASRLGVRRESVALMLARQELTPATINGRDAVEHDMAFRRLVKAAKRKVAA